MYDQAQSLRLRMRPRAKAKQTKQIARTIAVTSGKGGVGKTNFTLNFAIQLAKSGYKVTVFDADLGFANMDVLLGMTPRYSLYDLLQPGMTIRDVMERGPHGIYCIPGSRGVQELFSLTLEQSETLAERLKELQDFADFIIVDTGAGLTKETVPLILAADEVILVTTPEPTAITDGYAVLKYLFQQRADLTLWTVINRATSRAEAEKTGKKICSAAKQFLQCDVQMLGFLPDHMDVVRSVKRQQPFSECFPNSSVTRRLQYLTRRYLTDLTDPPAEKNKGFMHHLLHVIRRKN